MGSVQFHMLTMLCIHLHYTNAVALVQAFGMSLAVGAWGAGYVAGQALSGNCDDLYIAVLLSLL